MQQYLFNSQLFYSVKSHLKFPAKLVFPEFFAHVIATLLNWCFYIANGDEKCETEKEQRAASRKLIICFFDGLQTTINLLYGFNCQIYTKEPFTMQWLLMEYINSNNTANNDIFRLEHYLADQRSIRNYRVKLLSKNLRFHRVKTLRELCQKLRVTGCCEEEKNHIDEMPMPPDSQHYLRIETNCQPLHESIIGPRRWGPLYWNVFHSLAANATKMRKCDGRVMHTLNCYVCLLPFIIPCPVCRFHYNLTVKSSHIPCCKTVHDIQRVYTRIHEIVSHNVSFKYRV